MQSDEEVLGWPTGQPGLVPAWTIRHLSQDLLGAVWTDDPLRNQSSSDSVNLLSRCAGSNGDLPGVKGHVAPLDALCRQGTEGAKVLRQSHRSHDLCQIPSSLYSQDLECNLGSRMYACCPTHGAYR